MKKIIKLTENDLARIVKRTIMEMKKTEDDSVHEEMNEEGDHEENKVRTSKMLKDMERNPNSNRKERSNKGRQAPPPPRFKR